MAESVAFRLEGAVREKLEKDAQAHGMSPGQYARRLVVAALEGQGPAEQELVALRAEMAKLRDELVAAVRVLPKDLALDTHLVRFMAEYGTTQRELLERNLAALRRDLANAVRALLVGAGKTDKAEANEWVNAHLRRKD